MKVGRVLVVGPLINLGLVAIRTARRLLPAPKGRCYILQRRPHGAAPPVRVLSLERTGLR